MREPVCEYAHTYARFGLLESLVSITNQPLGNPARRPDLADVSLPDLYAHFAKTGLIRRLLELARDEDLGVNTKKPNDQSPWQGDITSRVTAAAWHTFARRNTPTTDNNRVIRAAIVTRHDGVIAGLASLPELVALMAPSCTLRILAADGDLVTLPVGSRSVTLAEVSGPMREVLALERTALNLLGRLCGVATRTKQFVDAIPAGSRAKLFDTRKTTPGLRVLEKYAVRCGGGRSHRIGLYDAVLIKDNHIAGVALHDLGRFVATAAAHARSLESAPTFIEVEVDTIEQYKVLLTLPLGTIDIMLLDNMGLTLLSQATAMRDAANPLLQLEASGGVSLETLPALARTGVDRISAGTLTHGSVSLDVAMDVLD